VSYAIMHRENMICIEFIHWCS